jgi:hypothetical protein
MQYIKLRTWSKYCFLFPYKGWNMWHNGDFRTVWTVDTGGEFIYFTSFFFMPVWTVKDRYFYTCSLYFYTMSGIQQSVLPRIVFPTATYAAETCLVYSCLCCLSNCLSNNNLCCRNVSGIQLSVLPLELSVQQQPVRPQWVSYTLKSSLCCLWKCFRTANFAVSGSVCPTSTWTCLLNISTPCVASGSVFPTVACAA